MTKMPENWNEMTEEEQDRHLKAEERRMQIQAKAKELAVAIADNINFIGGNKVFEDAFVEHVTCRTHRTLQQGIAQLYLKCFKAWAKQGDEGVFDLRNEDTVEAAKKIREALKDHGFRFI